MVIDLTKRPKLFLVLFIIGTLAFCSMFLLTAQYASGNAHAFPEAFAVDNQQRLYLLFGSGGYVVSDEQFEHILPSYDRSKTLWILDDNLLTYARNNHITVYDINQSDPEHGDLLKIDDFRAPDESFYGSSYGFGMTDEQNGVQYTYSRTLFRYTITQEQNGEQSVFFEMPQKDFVWNLVVAFSIVVFAAGILIFLLINMSHSDAKPNLSGTGVIARH